jgi:hypothetical protein
MKGFMLDQRFKEVENVDAEKRAQSRCEPYPEVSPDLHAGLS